MKIVALVALSFLCACQAQTDTPITDCSELGFREGSPFTGGDNSLCGVLGGIQCCSPTYLSMTVEDGSRMAFKEALKEELEDSSLQYGAVSDLMEYLDGNFISRLTQNFPFADQLDSASTSQLMSFLQTLASNLLIPVSAQDNFNPEEFISGITSQLGSIAATQLSGGNSEQQTCIRNVIMGAVNTDVTAQLVNAVQTIRQSASSLSRIQSFVSSYRQTLVDRFTPIRGCVERLARRSFCSRCSRRIPPLCRGTCNDLIRGCLSPVYSAYEKDFTQLRNFTQTIISNLETTIRRLYSEQGQIISSPVIIYQQLVVMCGLTTIPTSRPFTPPDLPFTPTPPPLRKRQADDDAEDEEERRTFDDARELLDEYSGIFEYDDDGPEFCEPSSREDDFCRSMIEPAGGRACRLNETCTSECRCWDGDRMVEMRPTRSPTMRRANGVREQGDNPEVDGLEDELVAQAEQLGRETPANAFLSSAEFMAVVPEGVQVPTADPYVGSAVRGVVSLVAIAIAALVGLLLL